VLNLIIEIANFTQCQVYFHPGHAKKWAKSKIRGQTWTWTTNTYDREHAIGPRVPDWSSARVPNIVLGHSVFGSLVGFPSLLESRGKLSVIKPCEVTSEIDA
jgi:hypothetical protein